MPSCKSHNFTLILVIISAVPRIKVLSLIMRMLLIDVYVQGV